MGFTDSLKKIVGIEEIDDDEIITEDEIEAAKEELKAEHNDFKDKSEHEEDGETKDTVIIPPFNKMQGGSSRERKHMQKERNYTMTTSTGAMKLLVIEPRNFEECKTLVDNLKSKKPIIINLEKLETEIAKKIFDFLSGATYALEGTVTKVTNNIFIFAPKNVGVTESKDDTHTETAEEQSPWR